MTRSHTFLLAAVLASAACDCGKTSLQQVECGDGVCQAPEGCATCPKDCACQAGYDCAQARNECFALCGDGTCRASDGENCTTCEKDCGCGDSQYCRQGACRPWCGNGTCEADKGETCATCEADCGCASVQECHEGACRLRCGNQVCDGDKGEGCTTCQDDCPCTAAMHVCLQNTCGDTCGNATCDRGLGENCATCATDCGCTEGICNPQSGECEQACNPSEDCRLTFPLSQDLEVDASTETTASVAVAADAGGSIFVGYGHHHPGGDGLKNDYFVRRRDGNAFVAAGTVSNESYIWGTRNLVSLGANRLLALWESAMPSHLRVAGSTNGGATWAAARQFDVTGVTDNGQGTSMVAVNNMVYSAYAGYVSGGGTGGSPYEVFFTKSTDGGTSWTTPIRLSRDTDQDDDTAVAVDGSLVVVAWSTFDGDIRVARSTDGGAHFGNAARVNDVVGKAKAYTGFVAVRGSRVHVVWSDSRTDYEGDVYMTTSLDSGATFGTPVPVHAIPMRRYQEQPSVAIAQDGRAWVMWQDHRNNRFDVYVAATQDGQCFCRGVQFNRTNGDEQNPRFVVGPDGALHGAWRHLPGSVVDIHYGTAMPQ